MVLSEPTLSQIEALAPVDSVAAANGAGRWSWRLWWRRQSPHRQDRFAILAPLLAVVLFSLAILATLTYLRLDENERESETVQRDVEYVQQRTRLKLTEGHDAVVALARDVVSGQVSAADFVEQAEILLDKHPEIMALSLVDPARRVRSAYT